MASPDIKRLPPCPGRTLVIGDVHGCADELHTLIDAFSPAPEDRLIAAGDLINRGPDSPGVLDLVRTHKIHTVLGNHEQRLLTAFLSGNPGTLKPKDRPTFDALQPGDWQQIADWPHVLHIPSLKAIVVHGGLDPRLPWQEQDASTLINIQVLDKNGMPAKRSSAPSGIPWAVRWKGPEHVYYGHTPRPHPLLHPFATGLDTGCVYGYTLTAVSLPDFEFFRVHARKRYVGG
jgi:predicted phosphodiesterase